MLTHGTTNLPVLHDGAEMNQYNIDYLKYKKKK